MIRVLVVDDEALARSRLIRLLSAFSDLEVVGEASNGLEALQISEKLKPDLAFLDIEMPELNGLEVAEAWGGEGPSVVFVTAYSEYALKAFEVSALDYLVKPVRPERLAETMERVRKRKRAPGAAGAGELRHSLSELQGNRAHPRMAVKCGAKYHVFQPSQVSAIIAKEHYAALLVEGKELLADERLDVLAQRMDPRRFLRIHRSAVINLDYLKELEHEGDRKYTAVLSDVGKTRLPVSRERLEDLKKALDLD